MKFHELRNAEFIPAVLVREVLTADGHSNVGLVKRGEYRLIAHDTLQFVDAYRRGRSAGILALERGVTAKDPDLGPVTIERPNGND